MNGKEQLLAFRIKSLNNQIRRLLERKAMFKNDADLTGMQYAVLGYLHENSDQKEIYQRDLEAEFNTRRSTASEMLKTLEKKGYIQRETDPVDSRLKRIKTTDKAKKLYAVTRSNMEKLQEQLMDGISEKEMKQFFETMQKISNNAEKQ